MAAVQPEPWLRALITTTTNNNNFTPAVRDGGSHIDVTEDSTLLGCDAVSLSSYFPMFRGFFDDEGRNIIRNGGKYSPKDTGPHSRRHESYFRYWYANRRFA
jgi:hypothetical protein